MLLGLLLVPLVWAEVPKIVPYVNDFADLLTKEEEARLNVWCEQIEQETGWEIAIVTVQNVDGDDRTHFANEIGDMNGVGKKDQDNGVVVLWSVDDDGGAIATGRYSESLLNDAKVGRIGRASREYFDQGLYYEGFEYISKQIYMEISGSGTIQIGNDTIEINESSPGSLDGGELLIILLVGGVGVFIIFFILYNRRSGDESVLAALAAATISSGSSGGGSSFSGGGFGGGGGSW